MDRIVLYSADDIVIAVMGMTGVGKSTFVSYFSESAVIGEGLVSCKLGLSLVFPVFPFQLRPWE